MSSKWRLILGYMSLLHRLFWFSNYLEVVGHETWTPARKLSALNQTKQLWYHGFNNYMQHAFPMDELRPLSCTGRGPDWEHPENIGINDVAANVSLTLIDVLDTFIALEDSRGFEIAVRNVIEHVSFDVDTKPQVFEITIRVLGGLLSGHIYASDPKSTYRIPWYRGQLLRLAHNLGERLLPAFRTSTGIPYARTNLRSGVPKGESTESCSAGAGSLIIEFSILSRLTGDDRFEKAASKAFFAIWNRRSDINLIGNTLNIWTGLWTSPLISSIGAGIDSFYEYALKWYIISGEVEYLDVFQEAYTAIMRYARSHDGLWYHSVLMSSGELAYTTVDSLSSFWPGLQVLAGDIENAIKSHLFYWNLWKRHSGMPEVFDVNFSKAVATQYPLRPEFVESTYYLYRATKDTFYLEVGERILQDITLRAKVDCGLAGILDLPNNTQDDRMESFVLSETLKYLALLFDENNPLHHSDSNTIFTTEGHLVYLNSSHIKPISAIRRHIRSGEHNECPGYDASIGIPRLESGLTEGIHLRGDFEWARHLVTATLGKDSQLAMEIADRPFWESEGWCEVPTSDVYSYEFILSSDGSLTPEETSPSFQKLSLIPEGYLVRNVTGIRAHIVSRMDGRGYQVTQLGPHAVRAGQKVHVTDTLFASTLWKSPQSRADRVRDVYLFFQMVGTESSSRIPEADKNLTLRAFTALFGVDFSITGRNHSTEQSDQPAASKRKLVRPDSNTLGCQEYPQNSFSFEDIVLVDRGACTFVEKLRYASRAGAAGVIVISDTSEPLNPSSDPTEPVDDLTSTGLVVLSQESGKALISLLEMARKQGTFITVTVESGLVDEVYSTPSDAAATNMRYIFLGGKPILNMIILV